MIVSTLVLLALPFLPIRLPFTICGYNFPEKQRHKNAIYIGGTMAAMLLIVVLMPHVLNLADWFANLKLVHWIMSFFSSYTRYGYQLFKAVFANILFDVLILVIHAICGGFCGLFRKEGKKSLLERLREFIAQWKARQAEKKAQKQSAQPQEKQKPEEILPSHLLPKPEKQDFSSKVRLEGRVEREQLPKAPGKKPAAEQKDAKGGMSWQALVKAVVGLFYEKREDGWYVQPQCKKVAKHLRNFIILVGSVYLVVFLLLMIPVFFPVELFAKQFYNVMNALVDNCYLYPSVSLVLLTEIFWFMNGRLPEEPVEQVAESRSRQKGRVVDLDKVERDLMKTFGKDNEVKSFYTDDVEAVEQSRNPVDLEGAPLLQSIVGFVEAQGLVRNDDYLRGIQALQQGKDTLFDAPLYTAAGMYLYPYLSMRISQGERIVVVCQDKSEIPAVIQNLEQGFRRVLRTHDCIWQVASRENLQTHNQTDVLVLTPQDFQDEALYQDAGEFLSRATLAMLPDADRVITSNNYFCLVMAERLRQHTAGDVQYLFLSTRHTLNLAGSLTQYFMLDRNVHTVQAEYAYGSLRLYIWKARNDGAALLDNSAQTVQMEVGIAKVAQANGIPNINLVSGSAIFPNQVNSKWLDVYDAAERPIGFAIVADDSFNLPSTIYAYSRYMGKQASVLHVICRPYLLRDYFFDHAARSLYEQPLMERGIAEHAHLQRSSTILLLCRLMQGLPVETFAAEVQRLTGCEIPEELDFQALNDLAVRCLQIAFGQEAAQHSGFVVRQQMDDRFHRSRIIQIREQGILDQLLADTALVTIRFTGGRPDAKLNLFKKMLDQRYLVGQNLVYDHGNYEVRRIDRERGVIVVDDASAVHNVPDDYIQVRHYGVSGLEKFQQGCRAIAAGTAVEDPGHVTGSRLDFQGGKGIHTLHMVRSLDAVQIESDTVAYYPIHGNARRLDLTDATVVAVKLSDQQRNHLRRKVGQGLYLKFEGDFVRSDRLTMTLAVLLQEMMKTLFPDQYFCIAVCPILADHDAIYQYPEAHCRRIAGMYPKLTGWGQVCPNSMELLIVDDCQGGTGVLDILYSPEGIYLRNVLDMLGDYLQWQQGKEDSYLYYGAKNCPAIFDLGGLKDLLQVFSRRYVREHDLFQNLQMNNCCSFCGKTMGLGESYLWDNRLNACHSCLDAYAPNEEECGKILAHCLGFLQERFGVTMSQELHAAQCSGKELSSLDVEGRTIRLVPKLPLVAVHSELMKQVVRLWQMENLDMTGEPEFEGQVLYVLLQYLKELEQHQHVKRQHRRALLGADDVSLGYNSLRQALQTQGTVNSFRYMLEHFHKGRRPPVRKVVPKRSTRVTPGQIRYLFREQLPEDQQRAYDQILSGLHAMEKTIVLQDVQLNQDQISNLWNVIWGDHSEMFWVNRWRYEYAPGSTAERIAGIVPCYGMGGEERQRRQEAVDEAVPRFLEGITPETSDYEAALIVYERMAMELDYDSLGLDREEQMSQWEKDADDMRSIYGALVLKKAVCAGYARAFQYLMQQLGIECIYVRGTCAKEERHGWNIIKLEGDYYHVDVTWGDNSDTDPTRSVEGYGYEYFCITDQDILLSRTIDTKPAVPACTAVACNYFVRSGLYFETYDHQALKARLLELLQDPKRIRVDMRFANAQVMNAARLHLVSNGGMFEILRASGHGECYTPSSYERFHILTFTFPQKKAEEAE